MGWTSSRVHVRSSQPLEFVAEVFRGLLLESGAILADENENDSGVARYEVSRDRGSEWTTVSRRFLDVEPSFAEGLGSRLAADALSISVFGSEVALVRFAIANHDLVSVRMPPGKRERLDAVASFRQIARSGVSDEDLSGLLSQRPDSIEESLGPLLELCGLPECQSLDDGSGELETISVAVRVRPAPTYSPVIGNAKVAGWHSNAVLAIESWPIDAQFAHLGFQNVAGGFQRINLEILGAKEVLELLEISEVKIEQFPPRSVAASNSLTAPFSASMSIEIPGAPAMVDNNSGWERTDNTRIEVRLLGLGNAPGMAEVTVAVRLDESDPVVVPLEIRVAALKDVPLPAQKIRSIPGGVGTVAKLWTTRYRTGVFLIDRAMFSRSHLALLAKRWADLPGADSQDFVEPQLVSRVPRIRLKEIGKSRKWDRVSDSLEATSMLTIESFTENPRRIQGRFTVGPLTNDEANLSFVTIRWQTSDELGQGFIQQGFEAFGDELAELGLLVQGSIYEGSDEVGPFSYLRQLGWPGFPRDRNPASDIIFQPSDVMWITEELHNRSDQRLSGLGEIARRGQLIRFRQHTPSQNNVELAVEALLPAVFQSDSVDGSKQ
jgi:hypothetical protein